MTRVAQGIHAVVGIAACAAIIAAGERVIGAEPAAVEPFYDNTLVCRDQTTRAICHAWFNRDGHYYVFYDLGAQPVPASIHGPLEFEGLEGSYTVRPEQDGFAVCLRPIPPPAPLAVQRTHEPFSEASCYPILAHPLGASWQQTARGHAVTLWLMAGR